MSDDTERIDKAPDEADQDDTEGHSLATYEYGRLVSRERTQEAERAARQARMRDDENRKRR